MVWNSVLVYSAAGILLAAQATAAAAGALGFSTDTKGTPGTLAYRVSTLDADGNVISAWHDIPLYGATNGTLNFFCEIPVNTTAKFETQTEEEGNPIAQDEKDGKPRDYPYPILWNYGMLPQTWEDPDVISEELGGVGGDNDPTDVVEIGSTACTSGQVYQVKPVCAFAMIDDGEVDWKVVVIPTDSPKASEVSNAAQAEEAFPGELQAIYEWFRDYKIPSGDPPAEFGYNGTCVDGELLTEVLASTHANYNALVSGERENTEDKALPEIKSDANAATPSSGPSPLGFSVQTEGTPGTLAYRVSTLDADGNVISAWHDIPLYGATNGTLNFFCEIPVNTTAKFETQTEEEGNPIAQDEKDGKPRDYPYPILWNYGMLPQTWEDPDVISEELGGVGGDNDPTDVVEIGSTACTSGQVYQVKPVCAFAMIDDGEVDWKVVVIPTDSPKASEVSNAAQAEEAFPGELQAIYEWFRDYKIPSGDPPAEFGYNGTCVDGELLTEVLASTHANYNALVSGERENTEDKALPEIKSDANAATPSSGPTALEEEEEEEPQASASLGRHVVFTTTLGVFLSVITSLL
ncbi:Soluble inorganic pyrophosphatase 1 [Picochlorum sp. SENEW3]|nr:Soluble inorganic pyrophosphatase 1 [Picochlorum sp. SENEW3]